MLFGLDSHAASSGRSPDLSVPHRERESYGTTIENAYPLASVGVILGAWVSTSKSPDGQSLLCALSAITPGMWSEL
jgi:hypothetical protein